MKLRIRFQCTGCGACAAICPDGAIHRDGKRLTVEPQLCRSCDRAPTPLCAAACPAGAMEAESRTARQKRKRREPTQ